MSFQTLDQIVQQYPIALPTLRHWIKTGKLPAFKPGRRVLVRPSDVDEIIASSAISTVRATRAKQARASRKARVSP